MDEATRKRYMQMPMPPSWEVKYDFSSRRYFYIDHNTKQTTWEDPRPDHYARMERQQQEQQRQQQQKQQQQQRAGHSYLSSQAAAAATSLGNRSPAASARRPETIALQQMSESPRSRQSSTRTRPGTSSQADAESDFLPLMNDQDFELAVLQSKFPYKPKEELQAALKVSNGNINLASVRLRQGFSSSSQGEVDRDLGGKCRSLCSDFPDMNQDTVMSVLKENEGNMYRSRERLKKMRSDKAQQDGPQVSMAAKVRALTAKFSSIEGTVIREMLEECNGDTAEVSRKLTIIVGDTAASASPGSAARHPSPQPRSVLEGTNSLDRQQKHRMLVSELASDFPSVERAVVRRTLASTGWKISESRQKLKELYGPPHGASSSGARATATPSPRPATAQSSGSSGSGQSIPSAPQVVQKPKPITPASKGKERKHKSKKSKDSKKRHKTKEKHKATAAATVARKPPERSSIAVGPNAELVKGPAGLARGSDPLLRFGPQPGLAKGPVGAVGRNTGLACGADPFLPKGSITRSYQTVLVL